jgi:hypothetical protein
LFHLKKQTGDNLYAIEFPDGTLIPFRLLTLAEFSSCRTSLVLGMVPPSEVYDYIFEVCVLSEGYQDSIDYMRAGVPDTLAKLILHMSGPNDLGLITQWLSLERQVAQTFESQMKTTICRAFSGYTMDKLDDLTFPQLVKLFAEAESLLLQTGQIAEPFTITDKNEQQKKSKFSVEEAEKDAEHYRKF